MNYTLCIVVIIIILAIVLFFGTKKENNGSLLSKNYYTVDEVDSSLNLIYDDLDEIQSEVFNVISKEWTEWPEKYLIDNNNNKPTLFTSVSASASENKDTIKPSWDIYPFIAFNVKVKEHCKACPKMWNFLKQIPGLKVALLSRLGPKTKLTSHRGWGKHSNNVIRCHFGFKVPFGCYISVKEKETADEEIKLQQNNKWLLFDDSRYHYAHNPTNEDRIVLIIDVERPSHIKTGVSDVDDTKELLQIIDYFKDKN